MKERLEILFLVSVFTAIGHWEGSAGRDMGESISVGLGASFAVLILILLSSVLDRTIRRKRSRGGPIGSMNTYVAERRREDRSPINNLIHSSHIFDREESPNFPHGSRPAELYLGRDNRGRSGREGGVN